MTALLDGWCGPSADAHRARWEQVNRGLGEFDHRVHMCSDRIRRLAGKTEDAQSAYDHALGLAGITAVAGIGLTLFTAGASDAVAGEAEATIGANLVGIVAEFEAEVGRLAALIGEMADFMGSLATRFAIEFEIRAPAPVIAAAAGAATNVAFTLADGDRALGDLLQSAAIGAAGEGAGLGRRGARAEEGEATPLRTEPVATEPVEQTWRAALKPAQAAKQATFDERARWFAKPENYGDIEEPLTGSVARAIDSQTPGSVKLVNQRIIDPQAQDVRELTDLDIVTDEVVIQIKSGETHGLSRQLRKSRSVTGKTVVGYAPAMKDNDFRRYQQEGDIIFRSLPELLGFLRGRLK